MKNKWHVSASTESVLGYGLLILALTTLGLFVASLALGSEWTTVLGIGSLGCLVGSVLAFRAAARSLQRSARADGAAGPASIFSAPLGRDDVDGYVDHYRSEDHVTASPIGTAAPGAGDIHSKPARLSA